MAKAKEILGIQCDRPTTEAVPRVLALRLEEMCLLTEAALDFGDPEGVHDMRVASRRLRSALKDFAPHLRTARIASFTRNLKEIADKLGVVRDLDVVIIALEKLQKNTTPEISSGLQKIIEGQKAKLDPARNELAHTLNEKEISGLKRDFGLKIESAVTPQTGTARSSSIRMRVNDPSYRVFARSTMLARLKELESSSLSLYEPQKTKPLHEMRIAAKRLRYAMELFATCWGSRLEMFSRRVVQMQSSLGELHDCDLWIEHFGNRLSRLQKRVSSERATSQNEREAMIWLLTHFSKLRTRHFRAALKGWHECEKRDFSHRLIATLKT